MWLMETDGSLVLFIHQILKKNKYVFLCFLFRDDLNCILATSSAPHYFYCNCLFNIKTYR
ncbi:hypothetical protein T4E_4115 [Trichinella pseudospiralis]|uniref:Uncharacterized protein n=1 Tax=Trichinella pseudospiralis TaxID=6337 RepID=A0A0V0XPF2_TRIPS|nr:hypothetical protein T4E_12346 [Trichinella pseudospiralis]KRX89743.1 hypothetical protein T4E_2276 [Trichinella pseudospiralis]KRX95933.1 hypothetical protein T4E_4115 [Trichinella pseudospiralis]